MDIDVSEQNIYDVNSDLLEILLSDKTTKKYIRWGTDNYNLFGIEYQKDREMKPFLIIGSNRFIIRPRVTKESEQKIKRTRDKAEVFTPAWVCNKQNNIVDEAWFGYKNVFNIISDKKWISTKDSIIFPQNKTWKDYVDARRLEISCGEAPYLVSRYDTVTGKFIPIHDRVGLLDRKMRIVNENTKSDVEWKKWAIRSIQSCYGYDFQGDNILLARENILYSFIDYYKEKFRKAPSISETKKIANIISWNIWQMNGITMTAPYSIMEDEYKQIPLFDYIRPSEERVENSNEIPCKIHDWRSKVSIEFRSIISKR